MKEDEVKKRLNELGVPFFRFQELSDSSQAKLIKQLEKLEKTDDKEKRELKQIKKNLERDIPKMKDKEFKKTAQYLLDSIKKGSES